MELTFLRPLYANAGNNADGFASVYLGTSGSGRGPEAKAVEIRWRDLRAELSRPERTRRPWTRWVKC